VLLQNPRGRLACGPRAREGHGSLTRSSSTASSSGDAFATFAKRSLLVTCRPLTASLQPTFDLDGRGSTLSADTLQKHTGWLIIPVLRHLFSPESLPHSRNIS
jgi:hypothetical protein